MDYNVSKRTLSLLSLLPATALLALAIYRKFSTEGKGKMTADSSLPLPRIISERPVSNSECKWLRLLQITYLSNDGKTRIWEKCERTTKPKTSEIDGVMIFCKIIGGPRDGCVVFVSQFRPCVGRKTLEFPAGLVDKNETCEQAALRELREETGLVGEIIQVTPVLFLDPGMSSSCIRGVYVRVDGTDPRNISPSPQLDEGEFCEVVYIQNPSREKLFKYCAKYALDANIFFACEEPINWDRA